MPSETYFRAGDWVQVKSAQEIALTLDENGQVDRLPFMPEMLAYCGQVLQVSKRSHKTCDPPSGIGIRSMSSTVHLEDHRCDGAFHGGCQHRCLFFWKEAWLKPAAKPRKEDGKEPSTAREKLTQIGGSAPLSNSAQQIPVEQIPIRIQKGCIGSAPANTAADASSVPVYVCQSSQLAVASQAVPWWHVRHYLEDYTSGNTSAGKMIAVFALYLYRRLETSRMGLGWFLRNAYDAVMRPAAGLTYPWRVGQVPAGLKTPSEKLNLRPGDLVRVKSFEDILKTLDENNQNRGMWFDPEMVIYCEGTFRVLERVERIVDEKTGKIQTLKNDCIILENVVCRSCYIKRQKFCPRGIYPFWREIWLERAEPEVSMARETSVNRVVHQ